MRILDADYADYKDWKNEWFETGVDTLISQLWKSPIHDLEQDRADLVAAPPERKIMTMCLRRIYAKVNRTPEQRPRGRYKEILTQRWAENAEVAEGHRLARVIRNPYTPITAINI